MKLHRFDLAQAAGVVDDGKEIVPPMLLSVLAAFADDISVALPIAGGSSGHRELHGGVDTFDLLKRPHVNLAGSPNCLRNPEWLSIRPGLGVERPYDQCLCVRRTGNQK